MNANMCELRPARATDLSVVVALLEGCGLPTGDVTQAMLDSFCVAEAEDSRGAGLAARLVDWCEAEARRRGVETVYLLTTTAADYFRMRGYTDVPRDGVPAAISRHAQFRSLCPASAKCLGKRL